MSFISGLGKVLKGFRKGVSVANEVAVGFGPVITNLVPGSVIPYLTVVGAIQAVELLIPQEGTGMTKRDIATRIIAAAHPELNNKQVGESIDLIVKAFNLLGDNKEKEVPVVPIP